MGMEAIKLFNKVAFAIPDTIVIQTTDARLLSAMNLEVATMGYTLGPDLMVALRALGDTRFKTERKNILDDLARATGADKNYNILFKGFPYSTPEQHSYMESRVLGHMASMLGIRLGGNTLTPLACGHVIDSALFNVEDFGACPICQHQVDELSASTEAKYPFASITPLKLLGYSRDFFITEANQMLARQSSLSVDERALIASANFLGGENGLSLTAPTGPIFKETLPLVYSMFGADAVKGSLSGATDVMRIVYYLSDENADLSMKENVKFNLSTGEKKGMLALLDSLGNLPEDMMRNRERWLRLGEKLKPGTAENQKRFPKAAEAFARLRNDPKGIETFNKKMEKGLRSKTVDLPFIKAMAERPGEFARKLDFMLRTTQHPRLVVKGFELVVGSLTEKLLLELRKYLNSRDRLSKRMFFPKGQANKVQIVDDKRKPISTEATLKIIEMIDNELRRRYAEKGELGRVFIDPLLKDVLLPFNRRGDSSVSGAVTKGSRFAFTGDVVRGFIWWKNGDAGRVDVDLSIVTFDDAMNNLGHVAYTCLAGEGMKHSGDIVDAPKGASEFIDFDVKKVRANGVRYIALSVISFTGQTFDTFECFAGFMERDSLTSGKVYEPESVKMRFDLSAKVTQHMPILFDLKERKVIYADMALASGGRGGAVARQSDKQAAMTEGMMSLPERKPTLFDVVSLNAQARGTIVESREDADVVFDFTDAEKLIAEGVA